MMTFVYLAGVSLGLLTTRINIFGGRGRIRDVGLLRAVLAAAAILTTFCLIVGGFIWLSLYWPVIGMCSGTVIAAAAVTRDRWASLFALQPVIDAATIIVGWFWLLSG
jgi:hypothetical protein